MRENQKKNEEQLCNVQKLFLDIFQHEISLYSVKLSHSINWQRKFLLKKK